MASVSEFLTTSQPLPLTGSTGAVPAFVSGWVDKRSISNFGASLVIYAVGSQSPTGVYQPASTPTGAAWIEYSNAPDAQGAMCVGPANGADDMWVGSGTSQGINFLATGPALNIDISATGVSTGINQLNYGTSWLVQENGAHWARVHWGASGTASPLAGVATGLSANVYFNGAKVST